MTWLSASGMAVQREWAAAASGSALCHRALARARVLGEPHDFVEVDVAALLIQDGIAPRAQRPFDRLRHRGHGHAALAQLSKRVPIDALLLGEHLVGGF